MGDLKKRVFFSFFAIITISAMIFFATHLYLRFLVALLTSIIGAFAVFEFVQIGRMKFLSFPLPLMIGTTILEIFSFSLSCLYPFLKNLPIIIFFVFFLFVIFMNLKNIDGAIASVSANIFAIFYIAIPLGMVLCIFNIPNEDGRWWIFYLISVVKMNDVGAYFIGKFLGKKKLAKHVSPNKTIAGSIGGLVFAVSVSLLFSFYSKIFTIHFGLNLTSAFILAVALSALAQIGDLAESLLKRDAEVKDSSAIPGFGGVLDILDSLLLNIPLLYFYLI